MENRARAARSALRSLTGSPLRPMPTASPRCVPRMSATAARGRSTSSCGGGRETDLIQQRPHQHSAIDGGERAQILHRHRLVQRSEEHTSELQSLMRTSYAVFCLTKKTNVHTTDHKT